MEHVFWSSKIQVLNISGDGFLKTTKNQRHSQVRKNGDTFKIFCRNILETFLPLLVLGLCDAITWCGVYNRAG